MTKKDYLVSLKKKAYLLKYTILSIVIVIMVGIQYAIIFFPQLLILSMVLIIVMNDINKIVDHAALKGYDLKKELDEM